MEFEGKVPSDLCAAQDEMMYWAVVDDLDVEMERVQGSLPGE